MHVRNVLAASVVVLGVFVAAQPAQAVTIYSAYEEIRDIGAIPLINLVTRDLQRTRQSLGTGTVVENNDAVIAAQNAVNAAFGIWNSDNVSYTHNLNWVIPPATTWLSAILTVTAFGPDGGNDDVIVDTVNIGDLLPEPPAGLFGVCATNPIDCAFTASVFTSLGDPVLVTGLIADGMLNILIDKNGSHDHLSVDGSRLDVTYSVPEPASLLLMGPALGYFAIRRRARKQ